MQAGPAQFLLLHQSDVETCGSTVQRGGITAGATAHYHHVMSVAHGVQPTGELINGG